MDLFAGKKLMDEGINAEMLEALTGDILPAQTPEAAAKVARSRMLGFIIESSENPNQVARARRGFANRAEERKARRSMVAQIRRYHRIMDPEFENEEHRPVRGRWPEQVLKRHAKRRRGNVDRKVNRAAVV